MTDRDDLFLFVVACFVCLLVGALIGMALVPNKESGRKIVYVVECGNFTLADGVFDPNILENITVLESGGILVVENLSMLEAFKE